MAPVRMTKNKVVYDIFLGVLRQNESRSRFTAFKKNPLLLVCLHSVCFFFRTKSIPFVLLLYSNEKKKTPGPMLRSPG